MTVPILLDVDAGTDDAVAIMLFIHMELKSGYKIVGITCTNGNTNVDNVIRNVLLVLESMNRTDIPVFRGAESTLMNLFPTAEASFHGQDGFSDKEIPSPSMRAKEENGIVAIQRLSEEHKGLTIICLCPLTTVALALKTYSDLKKNLGGLWIMGGNIQGIGNIPGTTAEFNFGLDPEAARIVLTEALCEITLLPWEPCIDTPFSLDWRFTTLGGKNSRHMKLLDLIEPDLYKKQHCWNPCDALLAAAFIKNQVINSSRTVNMHVELQGTYTRGQCVLIEGNPRIRIIESLNFNLIRELITNLAEHGAPVDA